MVARHHSRGSKSMAMGCRHLQEDRQNTWRLRVLVDLRRQLLFPAPDLALDPGELAHRPIRLMQTTTVPLVHRHRLEPGPGGLLARVQCEFLKSGHPGIQEARIEMSSP